MTEKAHTSAIGLVAACLVVINPETLQPSLSGRSLNVTSVAKNGTGDYTVTLSAGIDASNANLQATSTLTGCTATARQLSDTEVNVATVAGEAADAGFYLVMFRGSIG